MRLLAAMILLPIEIYLGLVVVIPLGVCFAKWKWGLGWCFATIACAAISWGYFNLWMIVLDPPDNGFAAMAYFMTGWVWLLPPFGLAALVFRIIESRFPDASGSRAAAAGYQLCVAVTVAVVMWNFVGSMSMGRALTEARHELREHGLVPRGREVASYEDGAWTIRYPDSDFGEIRLTRNGKMSWIGGPG